MTGSSGSSVPAPLRRQNRANRLPRWLSEGVSIPPLGVTAGHFAATGLVLLTALAALVPVYAMGRRVAVGPLPAMAVFALLAAALTGLTLLRGGLRILPTDPIAGAAAAFLLLDVVVSLVVRAPNLQLLVLTWTIWASAFLLAAATPRALARWVVIAWITIATLAALYAIYEQLSRSRILYRRNLVKEYHRLRIRVGGRRLLRAQATFGHPAPLASFLAASAGAALWAFPIPRSLLARLGRILLLGILITGIAATLTRGATLALILAVAPGLVARRTDRRVKLWVLLGGVVIALALLPTPLGKAVISYGGDVDELAHSPGRVATVRSLPEILSAPPLHVLFGWGGNSRETLYDRKILEASNNFDVIDNQYVSVLTETGVLGLTVFLAMLLLALRVAWTEPGWWPFGLGAALLALLVAIFFYEGLAWPGTAILFWALLGFLSHEARSDTAERPA
jgi:O-antigen ligase